MKEWVGLKRGNVNLFLKKKLNELTQYWFNYIISYQESEVDKFLEIKDESWRNEKFEHSQSQYKSSIPLIPIMAR